METLSAGAVVVQISLLREIRAVLVLIPYYSAVIYVTSAFSIVYHRHLIPIALLERLSLVLVQSTDTRLWFLYIGFRC